MITLQTEKREVSENLGALRKKGIIPAVFYGKKEKSTPISVLKKDFLKVWKEAGESSVITLKTAEGDLEALLHDVDLDPVTDVPRHADFYVFEKGHKIKLDIQLEFTGVAPAVKDLGGILVKVLREIKIEAMPKDLPHEITVDISPLINFESQILAKDIVLPSGVSLVDSPEEVVALVTEAKEEVEETVPVDLSTIEVEKKGKKEEEGAEGDAPVVEKEKKEKGE